jgi:hypothetical protein
LVREVIKGEHDWSQLEAWAEEGADDGEG